MFDETCFWLNVFNSYSQSLKATLNDLSGGNLVDCILAFPHLKIKEKFHPKLVSTELLNNKCLD